MQLEVIITTTDDNSIMINLDGTQILTGDFDGGKNITIEPTTFNFPNGTVNLVNGAGELELLTVDIGSSAVEVRVINLLFEDPVDGSTCSISLTSML